MPTPEGSMKWVDLGISVPVANVDKIVIQPAPVAGTIKSIWVGINTVLTTAGGTLAVAKGSANLLSAATYALGAAETPDLVAATPELAVLTTVSGNLKVAAGDLLKATWVLTTAAVTNAGICLVGIEPDNW